MRFPPLGLPVIGQPFKVLKGFTVAVIQCQCEAKTVITLVGKGKPDGCPACKKVYAIAESGTMTIGEVRHVLPAEGAPA